jgi:hypothetical protein
MTAKPKAKPPKLTDAERHARFVETARQVEVDESPEAFDRAFERVVRPVTSKSPSRS